MQPFVPSPAERARALLRELIAALRRNPSTSADDVRMWGGRLDPRLN
jgi:hypothetical protein